MFIPSRKAASFLGVHPNTLRHWADTGKIKHVRSPSGQRLYDVTSIAKDETSKKCVCYCRVSSGKQKDDLERQVKFMQEKFQNYEIITDIGSGINFKRKGLISLLERASLGNIQELVVAHRDRLSRFAFDLIKWFIEKNGGRIVVLDNVEMSPDQEIVTDIMSILTVFSCRIHGLRKYSNKIKKDTLLPESKSESSVE
jgi:predicted site-specific integrase-resolvase